MSENDVVWGVDYDSDVENVININGTELFDFWSKNMTKVNFIVTVVMLLPLVTPLLCTMNTVTMAMESLMT